MDAWRPAAPRSIGSSVSSPLARRRPPSEAGLSIHQWLDQLAEARPAGSEGLVITPYFLGEKTPIHDANARATFDGLTLSHDLGHLWRALLEAYAYAIAHHVEVMNEIGYKTERFIVSDGGSTSRVWMQIVADVLERPVQRLAGHPGSCVGAAWTAAIGVGLASDWSGISAFVRPADRIEPRRETANVYRRGYRRYRDLYRRLADAVRARCIMSLFRAVAWDIDGTLIDSEPLHQRALVAAKRCPRRRPQRPRAGGVSRRPRDRHMEGAQAALSRGLVVQDMDRGDRGLLCRACRRARAQSGRARGDARACGARSRASLRVEFRAHHRRRQHRGAGHRQDHRILAEPR